MGSEENQDEEGPLFPWLPPDDRLWRHPSEVAGKSRSSDPTSPARPGPRATPHPWGLAIGAGVVGAMVASAVFVATGSVSHRTTEVVESRPVPVTTAIVTPGGGGGGATTAEENAPGWAPIVEGLAPAVVAVSTAADQAGAGVVFRASPNGRDTEVLTAADLVTGAGTVQVAFQDGKTETASSVRLDPTTGIAVLTVPGTTPGTAALGQVGQLSPAETVLAMGPQSTSDNFVVGTVTEIDATVADQQDTEMVGMLGIGAQVPDTIDGGAVVNENGQVVGIYSAAASTGSAGQDVAYAVPIDMAVHVAQDLIEGIQPTHPWLGIGSATNSTPLGMAPSGGAEIGVVCAGGPAAAAGLRQYDVITALGNHSVVSAGQLITDMANAAIGSRVQVSYVRRNEIRTAWLRVANEPADVDTCG